MARNTRATELPAHNALLYTVLSEPTGERLNIALVAQLEGPAAMSMHDSPCLPACFALLDALAHSFHRVFSGSLHRRISAVINVF